MDISTSKIISKIVCRNNVDFVNHQIDVKKGTWKQREFFAQWRKGRQNEFNISVIEITLKLIKMCWNMVLDVL